MRAGNAAASLESGDDVGVDADGHAGFMAAARPSRYDERLAQAGRPVSGGDLSLWALAFTQSYTQMLSSGGIHPGDQAINPR